MAMHASRTSTISISRTEGQVEVAMEGAAARYMEGVIAEVAKLTDKDYRALTEKCAAQEKMLEDAKMHIGEYEERLAIYEGQGGTINMERSWKVKYRNALKEANQRLVDEGLEPVRIRKAQFEECGGDCDE